MWHTIMMALNCKNGYTYNASIAIFQKEESYCRSTVKTFLGENYNFPFAFSNHFIRKHFWHKTISVYNLVWNGHTTLFTEISLNLCIKSARLLKYSISFSQSNFRSHSNCYIFSTLGKTNKCIAILSFLSIAVTRDL